MSIFGRYRVSTFQIIAFGFFAMIMIGTLLLMLPISRISHESASFMDCLFTATSAVCVTGLVVQDTATYWSPIGQAVILLLIQIGGMGVVTVAVTLAFISGRRIGLMQRSVMQESISAPQVGGIIRLTRFIVITALTIEGIGSALLLPVFIRELGVGKGVWYAVFHSVSAFCNAGFDLMGVSSEFSSMTGYTQNILVNAVLIILITIGGIGFLVWNDIRQNGIHWKRYRLQSKLVLSTSCILVLLPFIWFLLHEMKSLPVSERILPSLFQSVTLRTAGFNTVDLNQISSGGHGMMIMCMLVGGSPGSTAGGVKTTTVAVMLLTARAVFRRREDVSCYGRRIGMDIVKNAVAILTMYLMLFATGGIVISMVEGLPLLTCLFETASALGTVGLSLGITTQIGTVSRGILIILMFLGRVGGLTLIYAAQSSNKSFWNTLPLEKLTVG